MERKKNFQMKALSSNPKWEEITHQVIMKLLAL